MDTGEDGHSVRAISCAHRGKYNRALSSSFLRQISALGEVLSGFSKWDVASGEIMMRMIWRFKGESTRT